MTSETSSAAKSGQESVVLASFDSYRDAEHMLALDPGSAHDWVRTAVGEPPSSKR